MSTLVLLTAAPAASARPAATGSAAEAAQPVTTGETEGLPEFSVVIVSPQDGAVFEGTPDAVVAVTVEFEHFAPGDVALLIDKDTAGFCPPEPPCTFEVTLTPGSHELLAIGDDVTSFRDEHAITVEVKDVGSDPESPTTEGPTDTDATDIDATDTDATTGDTQSGDTGGSGDKAGCGCSARPGAPDLLGLALLALIAPWRRRRRA